MHEFFIIGHRGAAGEIFENSLSGFEYALTLDIDAIELDVRAHSGELWVIHDNELERLTGSSGRFETIENPDNLRLLNKERIPKQTYDYVFYIVSAAVIGENPRLFGFDFENPLASVTH